MHMRPLQPCSVAYGRVLESCTGSCSDLCLIHRLMLLLTTPQHI